MKFSKLIKPELEEIINNANFTEDEEEIFILLAKGKSRQEISQRLKMSKPTIDRRIKGIKEKISKLLRSEIE